MKNVNMIRNDALVRAYQTMHTDHSRANQDAVTRQIVRATFLMPVLPVKGKLPEDFPPKVLKNDKGQVYLPLFSDLEQARAGMPGLAEHLLAVDISDAYSYIVDNKELQGVIINAFSKPNLICPRGMVESLAKLWSRVKMAEMNGEDPECVLHPQRNLKLLVPKVYPDGVAFALAAGLKKLEDVEKAWMCRVQKQEDDDPESRDWMIILQAGLPLKGRDEIFKALGQTLTPYLDQRAVIFVENNPNLQGLTNQALPIYDRDALSV